MYQVFSQNHSQQPFIFHNLARIVLLLTCESHRHLLVYQAQGHNANCHHYLSNKNTSVHIPNQFLHITKLHHLYLIKLIASIQKILVHQSRLYTEVEAFISCPQKLSEHLLKDNREENLQDQFPSFELFLYESLILFLVFVDCHHFLLVFAFDLIFVPFSFLLSAPSHLTIHNPPSISLFLFESLHFYLSMIYQPIHFVHSIVRNAPFESTHHETDSKIFVIWQSAHPPERTSDEDMQSVPVIFERSHLTKKHPFAALN